MLACGWRTLRRLARKKRSAQNLDAPATETHQADKTEVIVLQAIGPLVSADIGSRAVVLQATLRKLARLLSIQKFSLWIACQDGFFCSEEEWGETNFQRRLVPRRWIHKNVFGLHWDRLLAGETVPLGISEDTPPAHPLRSLVRDDPDRSLIVVPVLRKDEVRSLVLIKVSGKRRELLLREAISLKTIANILDGLNDAGGIGEVAPSYLRHAPGMDGPTHPLVRGDGEEAPPDGQKLVSDRTFPDVKGAGPGGNAPGFGPGIHPGTAPALPPKQGPWVNQDTRGEADDGEKTNGMAASMSPAWKRARSAQTSVWSEGIPPSTDEVGWQTKSAQQQTASAAWHNQLARELAHDFNNVIASIAGSAALIEMRPEKDVVSHARRILQAADQASGLVRKILEKDMQSNQSLPIRFCESLKRAASIVRPTLPDDLVLEVICHAGNDYIKVEPTEFFQVVLNLVVNSRDAFPAGQVERWIRVSGFAAAPSLIRGKMAIGKIDVRRRYVCLEVCDNGCGMEASVAEKMFHPYFTTKGVDGTGLGMAIVSRIVRGYNGAIHIDSALGTGTRIRIFWPLMDLQNERGSDPLS